MADVTVSLSTPNVQVDSTNSAVTVSTTTANVVIGQFGQQGLPGPAGAAGVGVPAGGTTGQVLVKIDGTDYNTQWVTGGGSYGDANVAAYLPTYTGNLSGNNLSLTNTANIGGNLNVTGTFDAGTF